MRRVLAACLLATGLSACFAATTGVTQDEYRSRRAAFKKEIGEGVFIMFGALEGEHGNIRENFFQEPNFYYLTGWTEPGAALVMTPTSDILLLPKRVKANEKWTGVKIGPDDPKISQVTGFENVMPVEVLEQKLNEWISSARKIYTLSSDPQAERIKKMLPLREVADAGTSIAKLRMKKSPAEVALIQRSTDASVAAHLAAWKRIKAGLGEYQIASTMMATYFDMGCERNAYSPIVGAGEHGAILHYAKNSGHLDNGQLVLMDVGSECSMYATDITRTVPVSGKFTARQKELYDIVLGAQKAAIAAVKPGASVSKSSPNSLYRIAYDYINTHGKDLHGEPLGKYFTHGLGHHVGLDVHDADDKSALQAGMVITVEPGIYIPEEGIGIRIEDMVLVTDDGAQVLSAKLPKEVAEIERIMARP